VAKLDLPVAKEAAEYGPVKPSQTSQTDLTQDLP
jgi:hypothetical protein